MQALGPGGHQRQMGDFGDIMVLEDAAVQKFDLQCSGSLFETDGLDVAGHHINAFHGFSLLVRSAFDSLSPFAAGILSPVEAGIL